MADGTFICAVLQVYLSYIMGKSMFSHLSGTREMDKYRVQMGQVGG